MGLGRLETLTRMKTEWASRELPLGDRIRKFSAIYYSFDWDPVTVAESVGLTSTELEAILDLGGRDDVVIAALNNSNPSLTACAILSACKDDEIISILASCNREKSGKGNRFGCRRMYQAAIEVVGPTPEMNVSRLPARVVKAAAAKGEAYGKLSDWGDKFLKDIATRLQSGRSLTDRQTKKLVEILSSLCDEGVIVRESKDGDRDICDEILDALER